MLVGMGCNHALLVKLADRLHDMRTLGALPAAQRNLLAQETVDVWAPLANRLGVWSLKAQLEDLAFKQLFPAQVCGEEDEVVDRGAAAATCVHLSSKPMVLTCLPACLPTRLLLPAPAPCSTRSCAAAWRRCRAPRFWWA